MRQQFHNTGMRSPTSLLKTSQRYKNGKGSLPRSLHLQAVTHPQRLVAKKAQFYFYLSETAVAFVSDCESLWWGHSINECSAREQRRAPMQLAALVDCSHLAKSYLEPLLAHFFNVALFLLELELRPLEMFKLHAAMS